MGIIQKIDFGSQLLLESGHNLHLGRCPMHITVHGVDRLLVNPSWEKIDPHARPLNLSDGLQKAYNLPSGPKDYHAVLSQLVNRLEQDEGLVVVYHRVGNGGPLSYAVDVVRAWEDMDRDLRSDGWIWLGFYAVKLSPCQPLFVPEKFDVSCLASKTALEVQLPYIN